MRKYNLFDNFLCLIIGGIIAIFVYHQFQLSYHKPQENTEDKELLIVKDLSIQQKKDLISELKTILLNFNNVNYLYKKDIKTLLDKFLDNDI